jgi:transcriptional regulator with XRE-family HTH domain
MSLQKLGELTGQKHQSIARQETGETPITFDRAEQYAKVLKIKPEELLREGLRVNPKMRGLVEIFDTLTAEDQDRFLRMGYAFAEPNVRFLPPPDQRPSRNRSK